MNTLHLFCVASYEAKLTSRLLIFRLFAVMAVVGVIAFHHYNQGLLHCTNWKLVALASSIPLMNAYVFSVLQALFVIFIAKD